ncbi:MAG: hypothetical protein ACI8XO_000044 [Verrucomicrobiales bacterium]|jgi:hypothetical protein
MPSPHPKLSHRPRRVRFQQTSNHPKAEKAGKAELQPTECNSVLRFIAPILLLGFAITNANSKQPVDNPKEELLTLGNGTAKIGIDRAKGASITHLSWASYPKNAVNGYDPGRLIQQSYYAGRRLDRQSEGQHKAWSPWSWNPIQGGGVGSWARVTEFKRLDENTLYGETVPKLWDMPDEEAEALMHQWIRFEPAMPNTIAVTCELIARRQADDRWGPANRSPQEIPATYFTRNFDTFKMYEGAGKWSELSQKPGPPWGNTKATRNAIACFEKSGQGVAIFSPAAATWNYGPHAGGKTDDPLGGPCVHIAPVARVLLGPRSTVKYRYWLVTGTESEIGRQLEKLWEKYKGERIQLSE